MQPSLHGQDREPQLRRAALERARSQYRWDYGFLEPMPLMNEPGTEKPNNWDSAIGWLKILPRTEWPTPVYLWHRVTWTSKWTYYMKATVREWQRDFLTHADYDEIFNRRIDDPWCINNWKRDSSFAYHRLAGPNPMVIRRVKPGGLPPRLCVKGTPLEQGLPDGTSLEAAIDQRRLYVTDYAILQDLPLNPNRFLPVPIGVFYVDWNKALQPLAIQLGQEPKPEALVTPRDGNLWWTAKILYQVADLNHHEMVNHLCRTHFILEGVSVAMHRTLPPQHPLHLLLKQHLRFLIWNNFEGRQKLISADGFATDIMSLGPQGCVELVRRAWAGYGPMDVEPWDFDMWDLPKELESRGVFANQSYQSACWSRHADLCDYHYRDDGLLIWQALEKFVNDYVSVYYPRDSIVVADPELQGFVSELAHGAKIRNLSDKAETIQDVVRIVQRIIWAAAPLHAAVNFPQYGFMAYVPNMPAALYKMPDLTLRGDDPDTQWKQYVAIGQMLPPPDKIKMQLYTMMLLTAYRYDKLGHYGKGEFTDPAALRAISAFQSRLADVEKQIKDAQAVRRGYSQSYQWLMPSLITNSTSI